MVVDTAPSDFYVARRWIVSFSRIAKNDMLIYVASCRETISLANEIQH